MAVETNAADKANKTDNACEAGAAKVNEADVAVKPDKADESFDAEANEADELTSKRSPWADKADHAEVADA